MKINTRQVTHGVKETYVGCSASVYEGKTFNEKTFYKDDSAFTKKQGVCYISHENLEEYDKTLSDLRAQWENDLITRKDFLEGLRNAAAVNGYTYKDILAVCGGVPTFAEFIYGILAGEVPEELISQITFDKEAIDRLGLKPLQIKDFYILDAPSRKGITDSLLLPSGLQVLSGKIRNITVTIETQGHVNISWKEENYRYIQDFPADLVEAIRSGRLNEHPEAEVLENNWYEVFVYDGKKLIYSDVIDIDLNDLSDFEAMCLIKDIANDDLRPGKGDIVRINKMDDRNGTDWQARSMNGAIGYVYAVDSAGQLHGSWGGLALIPNHDKFAMI